MHWMEAATVAINMNGWHHVVVVGREQVIQCLVCPRLILLFHTEEHHPQSTDYDYIIIIIVTEDMVARGYTKRSD